MLDLLIICGGIRLIQGAKLIRFPVKLPWKLPFSIQLPSWQTVNVRPLHLLELVAELQMTCLSKFLLWVQICFDF